MRAGVFAPLTAVAAAHAMQPAACAQSPLARSDQPPTPVILSTDCGTEIDDQWCVAYLAISPELRVLGFLGNHAGSQLNAAGARDTVLDVLVNRLDLADPPPVLAGSDDPIESREKPNDNKAVRFLIDQSRAFTPLDRLNVLVIGSHSDVASAILTDPSIVERIRVVMMGIDDWPGGGDPWNVKNDPEACRVVLESGVPLVVGPGEVCKRDLSFTTEECRALLQGTGKCGEWLADCFTEYKGRFDVDGRKIWPIWDNITAGYLLGFTRSVVHHRPWLAEDLSFDHSEVSGQLTWVEWVDSERLWADFAAKLKAWDAK